MSKAKGRERVGRDEKKGYRGSGKKNEIQHCKSSD